MATEKLKFKLELWATMWDNPPHAEILINEHSHFKGDITGTEEKPTLIEFEHDLVEDELYSLVIKRSGKTDGQTVVDKEGKIIKDQVLHIKYIEIDEIDLGALVYEGTYTPIYPEPWATQQRKSGKELQEKFKNVTSIGHDGDWKLTFKSPFYMWLLENLY